MKSFIAEDSFWELFPQAAVGVVVVEGMKPTAQIPQEDVDAIAALLDRANIDAERHLTSDTISENVPVKAWREAYRLFKTKKGARCSIENLLKRVLKGKPVGHITPAVDIYNTVSLSYALPVGGEDLHAIEGDLRLKVTDGGDAFLPLGEEADDPTLAGELAYIDDAGAVCRCWNWRDGVRTALSDDSADAFLAIECVEPERMGDCQAAIDRLAELLERYLGATAKDQPYTLFHRKPQLPDRTQRIKCRDRRSLVICRASAVNSSVYDLRLKRLCHSPVLRHRNDIKMRQNIQRLLLRPEIAGHNVVVIVCRLKPILLHQSFCRCNYLSRAVTKRLSFLRPATLTVDPYERL